MAFTTSLLAKTVFGDMRVHAYRFTADAATQSVDTGLDYVHFGLQGFQSATTAAIKLAVNEGAEGTALAGYIALTGCTSGDEYFVAVFGR